MSNNDGDDSRWLFWLLLILSGPPGWAGYCFWKLLRILLP